MSGGLIRKRLSEREGAPPDTRYNPDCDCVETSVDGGATWNENVGADPRVNIAYLLPPNEEPDPRCAAAAGMVEYIRQFVDAGVVGTSALGIANSVFGIALVFIPVSWFFALILAIGTLLFEIGAAALAFSFTEEVYDQLQCIFYNYIDSDGVMTESDLALIYAEVATIGDVTVTAVFGLAVQPLGFVGMTNAGSAYADPDAECVCANWCFIIDLTVSDGGMMFQVGTWSSGVGAIQGDTSAGGTDRTIIISHFNWGEAAELTTVDVHYDYHKATSAAGTEGVALYKYEFADALWSEDQNVAVDGDDLSINLEIDPAKNPIDGLSFWLQSAFNAFGGTATITTVQVAGTGEAPEWFEDNGWEAC